MIVQLKQNLAGWALLGLPVMIPANAAIAQAQTSGTASATPSTLGENSASPVAANGHWTPARPNGQPRDWIGDDDYPAEALNSATTGIVKFRLSIATDGSVSECEITVSSKNAILDQTSCALITKRAHFFPATNPQGQAVIGTYYSSVTWQIPATRIPHSTHYSVAYDILPDGALAHCEVTSSGFTPAELVGRDQKAACPSVTQFDPPIDAMGKPVTKHVVFTMSTSVTDVP